MKTGIRILIILATVLVNFPTAAAVGPCQKNSDSRHASRMSLNVCLNAWAKDVTPGSADPTDQCARQLSEFVQSTKDLKACLVKAQPKK